MEQAQWPLTWKSSSHRTLHAYVKSRRNLIRRRERYINSVKNVIEISNKMYWNIWNILKCIKTKIKRQHHSPLNIRCISSWKASYPSAQPLQKTIPLIHSTEQERWLKLWSAAAWNAYCILMLYICKSCCPSKWQGLRN